MTKLPSFFETLNFIKEAHSNQLYGLNAYWYHPLAVALSIKTEDEELATIALLHDVVEDTDYTLSDLYTMGYTDRIIDALVLLTKTNKEDYMEYIERLVNSENVDAISVKLADMGENSRVENLIKLPEEKRDRLQRKYARAFERLMKSDVVKTVAGVKE